MSSKNQKLQVVDDIYMSLSPINDAFSQETLWIMDTMIIIFSTQDNEHHDKNHKKQNDTFHLCMNLSAR